MKIIISPAKTMKPTHVSWLKEKTIFEKEKNNLFNILKTLNNESIQQLYKISLEQSKKVYHYFHHNHEDCCALAFYQGAVFKELQLSQYEDHLDYLNQNLRILSAYYGVLKYNTAITYYRLDMNIKLPDINLYDYWRIPINKYFEKEDCILSLASKEYTSIIKHPHLYFVDFVEIKNDKEIRNAMTVKKARGAFLNEMIRGEVSTLDELKRIKVYDFHFDSIYDKTIKFIKQST